MLGVSMGELLVLVAAAAWAFGPNELPRVARAAGRLTGQATGFLYRTRARFFKFAEETEMNKLHQEMQATMYQLNAIRSELQGGINLFQPGPLTQRVLSIKPMPGNSEGMPPDMLSAQQGHQPAAAGLGQAAPTAAPPPLQQQPAAPAASQADLGSFAASALLAADRQQHVQRPQQLGAAQGAAALRPPPQQGHEQQAQGQEQGQVPEEVLDDAQHPLTVPVSAVAAGWAPDRSGRAPTGSEVFLDALAEELLAAQVLRLQQQQLAMQAQQAAAQRQAAARAEAQQGVLAQQQQGVPAQQQQAGPSGAAAALALQQHRRGAADGGDGPGPN
ncbi:hypothetical protein ABPG77_006876 [Micractinium sp. CCAP 211/92]